MRSTCRTGHVIRASLLDYRGGWDSGRYFENYKTKSINVLSKSLGWLHGVLSVARGNNFIQICNFLQFTFLTELQDCQWGEQCQSNYYINSWR